MLLPNLSIQARPIHAASRPVNRKPLFRIYWVTDALPCELALSLLLRFRDSLSVGAEVSTQTPSSRIFDPPKLRKRMPKAGDPGACTGMIRRTIIRPSPEKSSCCTEETRSTLAKTRQRAIGCFCLRTRARPPEPAVTREGAACHLCCTHDKNQKRRPKARNELHPLLYCTQKGTPILHRV